MEKYTHKINCPGCGGEHLSLFIHGQDFHRYDSQEFGSREKLTKVRPTFLKCQACQLLVAQNKIDPSFFQNKVREGAYQEQSIERYAARTYFNLIKGYIRPDQFSLEVGCSGGEFMRLLNSPNLFGVEPNRAAYNSMPLLLQKQVSNDFLENYFEEKKANGELESFANIFSFQIMEHHLDIERDLHCIQKLLHHKGQLFLVLHNYDAFINRLLGESSPVYEYQHRVVFHPKSIEIFLSRMGFEIVQMRSIVNFYPVSYAFSLLQKEYHLGLDPLIPFPTGNLFVRAIKR